MQVACPNCGEHCRIDRAALKEEFDCPHCRNKFVGDEAIILSEKDKGISSDLPFALKDPAEKAAYRHTLWVLLVVLFAVAVIGNLLYLRNLTRNMRNEISSLRKEIMVKRPAAPSTTQEAETE